MTFPRVRRAVADDAPVIYELICALAEFEHEPQAVRTSPQQIVDTMFTDDARVWAELVEDDQGVQGMALWFHTYSTWEGTYGIHLEDLYLRPSARGKGYTTLLFHKLAMLMEENGWSRLEWNVLTWNQSAIEMYDHLGGKPVSGWYQYRMVGEPVTRLAEAGRAHGVVDYPLN